MLHVMGGGGGGGGRSPGVCEGGAKGERCPRAVYLAARGRGSSPEG